MASALPLRRWARFGASPRRAERSGVRGGMEREEALLAMARAARPTSREGGRRRARIGDVGGRDVDGDELDAGSGDDDEGIDGGRSLPVTL